MEIRVIKIEVTNDAKYNYVATKIIHFYSTIMSIVHGPACRRGQKTASSGSTSLRGVPRLLSPSVAGWTLTLSLFSRSEGGIVPILLLCNNVAVGYVCCDVIDHGRNQFQENRQIKMAFYFYFKFLEPVLLKVEQCLKNKTSAFFSNSKPIHSEIL